MASIESPFSPQGIGPEPLPQTRLFYWSVRRELWENRFVYIGPLVVMAFVLLGSLIGIARLPHRIANLATDDSVKGHHAVVSVFEMAPAPIMLATFLIGMLYSLDALYGERRDRSILFWKSLPVSDRTTVLSKASIPLVVLPLIALALSFAIFFMLLLSGTAVLLVAGISPGQLWREVGIADEPLTMVYGMAVHTLWFAPIYGWLLLVSCWSRRTPLLWATLPLFAVAALERIAFSTSHFASLLAYRFTGAMDLAFVVPANSTAVNREWQLDPARFLMSPGLWIGLAFAAAALLVAERLRRYREPI